MALVACSTSGLLPMVSALQWQSLLAMVALMALVPQLIIPQVCLATLEGRHHSDLLLSLAEVVVARLPLAEPAQHRAEEGHLKVVTSEEQHRPELHPLECQVTCKQLALRVAVEEEGVAVDGQRQT